jgi:molybdenum cofactor synthesis domain-containing protein
MVKTAAILVIGNEILSGKTADENSLFLSRELRELGVDVRRISVIPDELETIAREVRQLSMSCDYVFTTGGVGPTHDDLTMEGIAGAFEDRIRRHPELEAALRRYYPADLVEPNLRMADVPESARLIDGPGLWFPVIAVNNVFIFPGVPEILRRKFGKIREMFREEPFHMREVYLRCDEGKIAAILHRVLSKFPDLLLGSYPYFDSRPYSLKLTLDSKDPVYLDAAHKFLVDELATAGLSPLANDEVVRN